MLLILFNPLSITIFVTHKIKSCVKNTLDLIGRIVLREMHHRDSVKYLLHNKSRDYRP